jgi:hypothetical protein
VQASFPGMPEERMYELRFPVSFPPVEVKVNKEILNYNESRENKTWNYNGDELTTYIYTPKININKEVYAEIEFPKEDIKRLSGKKILFRALVKTIKEVSNFGWEEKKWDESKANSDSVIWLAQTGTRITLDPPSIFKELKEFDRMLPVVLQMIEDQKDELPRLRKYHELLHALLRKAD